MPIKFTIIFIITLVISGLIATLGSYKPTRKTFASPMQMKLTHQHFQSQIEDITPDNVRNHLETHLLGSVQIKNVPNSGSVSYRWHIPKGIQLLSGKANGRWENVQVGQILKSEIIINSTSAQNEALGVSFEVISQVQGINYGSAATYIQDSFQELESQNSLSNKALRRIGIDKKKQKDQRKVQHGIQF